MKEKFLLKISRFFKLLKSPIVSRIAFIVLGASSVVWFLIRVIPKPQRATYPCMQASAPLMSGFVIWLMSFFGTALGIFQAKQKFLQTKYAGAVLFLLIGVGFGFVLTTNSAIEAIAVNKVTPLEIWYQPNSPMGTARGIFPGRVTWAHNPEVASWDGETGFWWEDQYNDQNGVDKLLQETLTGITDEEDQALAWDALFRYFNQTKRNFNEGYQDGEKIAIKINQNNTYSQSSNNEINANPLLILSLLRSLVNEANVPQPLITVSDPSRFVTDNIFDKCHAEFPSVIYEDHVGENGRVRATYLDNAIPYSEDNGKVAQGLATSFVEADYIINMSLMKGHVSQGVTLSAKNYFGCTNIHSDWRDNHHSSGFSQNQDGTHKYLVFPDFLGHKDLGGKTMLFLIDGIYSNKFVDRVPAFKWELSPFDGHWPSSLFASQDGVAVDAVVLDFIIEEWPDAPDMMYSDYYLRESALAFDSPSGTIYDPEQDGTTLGSLGVMEHWNNAKDKQYTRNLGAGEGIELIYRRVD
jgi:hypothetical protein